MSEVRNRRAVYTVLSEYLPELQLWPVMWLWQREFADRSPFELNAFFTACSHFPVVKQHRASLYRQLIALLMDDAAKLKPDPWPAMQRYQQALQPATEARDDAELAVFNEILASLFYDLRSDTAVTVTHYVMEQAGRRRLSRTLIAPALMEDFARCAKDGERLTTAADTHQLRALLNLIYIGLCECLGPVVADRMLNQAVERAGPQARPLVTG